MAKRFKVDLELPDDLFAEFGANELAAKAREALIMELLREHRFSQGKAAELLGLNRHQLFEFTSHYRVPAIDLTAHELNRELERPLSRS